MDTTLASLGTQRIDLHRRPRPNVVIAIGRIVPVQVRLLIVAVPIRVRDVAGSL
jgi:hypothetical protein